MSAPAEGRAGSGRPRVGYLGPEGTFTEEALLASAAPGAVAPVALGTIYDTIVALARGEVEWAVVPIENSLDGSVSVTLDLLAGEASELQIVGEALLSVRHSLIAPQRMALGEIETVLTHPQVPGQCGRFLRGELAHARVLPASSTAEAVRIVAGSHRRGQAALGTALAAEIYGAIVLREGIQDRDDNETRFVWLGRRGETGGEGRTSGETGGEGTTGDGRGGGREQAKGATGQAQRRGAGTRAGAAPDHPEPPLRAGAGAEWKTSLVFWGPGADSPGWLVRCLDEFGRRDINLTKIESRPKRERMGHYLFFVDLQGRVSDATVAAALAGLGEICEVVRVLGSYRAGAAPATLRR